jgi:hypothetical protein
LGRRAVALFCDETKTFAYVAHNWDDNPKLPVDCLQRRGAVRIHIVQRLGSFDVWLATARSEVAR